MTTYTTGQVARILGITKQRIHAILANYPGLRPIERDTNAKNLLWSEPELAALRSHLEKRPFTNKGKNSRIR
mgnify:CR=1 FL=1